MVTAKAAWEVRAGVMPEIAQIELTKRWFYTSDDHDKDQALLKQELDGGKDITRPDAPLTIFSRLREEAFKYANTLHDPRRLNWVEVTWIWY